MAGEPRDVAIVAYPGAHPHDVSWPCEALDLAARLIAQWRPKDRGYRTNVLAWERASPDAPARLSVTDAVPGDAPLDTVIVAGSPGRPRALAEPDLVCWLASVGPATRRVGSVGTGAFLLAEAGLLDGRRATTERAYAPDLADRYPRIVVEAEPVCVRDGPLWSSRGATAGIDLTLLMLEDDLDHDLAQMVAWRMASRVHYPLREAQRLAAGTRER
jgi:transcriptional regulator GlxA family with amidase domain